MKYHNYTLEQNPADDQLVVSESGKQYLPSVDVREIAPIVNDTIDLRDILDIFIRRKWIIVSILLFLFFSTALFTFTQTPLYLAKGIMKVSAQGIHLTKFDNLETSALKTLEFQQTEVNLLTSEQLANRVIEHLDLINNKHFTTIISDENSENNILGVMKGVFASLTSFIRFDSSAKALTQLDKSIQERIVKDEVIKEFNKRFSAIPIRNSELIQIKFESPDPALAAEVTNTAMDEFIHMHMDSNIKASETAENFLSKQIHNAQIKLEKSEKQLHAFASHIGIVSLDPKLNLVLRQLEELNDALAKAQAERIGKEAIYHQAKGEDSDNLPQILNNELIQTLKDKLTMLQSEYKDQSTTFKDGYPKMQQLIARMHELEAQILAEKKRIINSIRNNYESALKKQEYLQSKAEEQKKRALDLEEKATQYKIFIREVETNKTIYQSLLQRSKEIEATVGADVTNIQVVDMARIPLYPHKPRVALNLVIGLVLGLLLGAGTALFMEYIDNTIKNPDELTSRFNIPVLGLIPFDKDCLEDRKTMALQFYYNPRCPVTESIRTIMTSLRLSSADKPPKTVMVTSILPEAGKSSFACNAALSFLSEGENCLLIDTDLRKPNLHRIFSDGTKGRGLSSVLSGITKLSDVIQKTDYKGLDFISSGPLPPNPAELLSSKRMRQLLSLVGSRYNHVILDCPPYQGFAEILVLSNMVDGVILMTVEGSTPREGVRYFRKSISNVGGNILGAIMNKSGMKKGYGNGSYGSYKYYSYNYEYGQNNET